MIPGRHCLRLMLLMTFLNRFFTSSVAATCELSVVDGNRLYNYSLVSPTRKFPHGVLSEDGFYNVAVNGTMLWFQLCDGMVFNHNPPKCLDCRNCGGPSSCGMNCSALVSNNVGGYHVCTTIGRASSIDIMLIEKKYPSKGVIIKMSSGGTMHGCSLSVSVICDLNSVQGPNSLEKINACDYSTELRHPAGCAEVVSIHGRRWGWFSTLLIIFLGLFSAYLLAGSVYRYFALGIRGLHVVPNLGFWASLPHSTKAMFVSLIRRFRGPSASRWSSYSAVDF